MRQAESDALDLQWIRSPVAENASVEPQVEAVHVHPTKAHHSSPPTTSHHGQSRSHRAVPDFKRHDGATSAEVRCQRIFSRITQLTCARDHQLFFDLFFAANLTVFSEVHEISDHTRLTSYIGYFCLLWFTWALVSLFDVRFVADSIFERVARAGHLGVMIGLAVVGSNFHFDEPDPKIFRVMSLCLMASRIILSLQYATIMWHLREYRESKKPLAT